VIATVLRFSECPVLPWRNNRGKTREIACEPADAEFDWRVSVAEVEDAGEFSTFPGVDRVIVLCAGPGMTLLTGGTEQALRRHVPFSFPGDAAASCQLAGGPTRDLNVMTRRSTCSSTVSVFRVDNPGIEINDHRLTIAVALDGTILADASGSTPPIRLAPFDAVRLDTGSALRIASPRNDGIVAVIHIDTHRKVDTPGPRT
jgi:environmental stress-induced protein Ves